MTAFRQYALRSVCATSVAAALMLQPLAAYAAAIVPSLGEIPIQGLNPVKPNLMFTLDDSGSMAFEFVPDYVSYYVSQDQTGNHYFCLNQLSASGGRICGWARNTWGGGGSPAPQISDPPVRSSDFNHLYYNASVAYDLGVTELRTALNYETPATAGTWTQVYADAYDNYVSPPATFTPATKVNLTNAYPDTIWCWKSAPTAAEKLTADLPPTGTGTGAVCRRNGYAYPGNAAPNATAPVAAGYNYPNRSDGQYCKNTVGVFDCNFAVTGAPYYYTISKVQFCSTQDTSASPSLNRGFGKGTCSPNPPDATLNSRWDFTTYQYVRYGTDPSNAFQPSAFTRVDIRSTGFLVNGVAAANPTGRTYAQEMTNFAKWYAFYRTRINSMKTAAGLAFTALDETNSRVGFHTIHQAAFKNVLPFNPTNKAAWFKAFYNIVPSGGTPLPDAMWRIGQLFSNPNTTAWTNTTGISGAADPLDPASGACQDNYHLLSTDGYWNVILAPGNNSPDQDNKVLALPTPGTVIQSAFDSSPAGKFTVGSRFPNGYWEGPTPVSNNLADLAMKYWINDIRKDFPKPAFPNQKVPGDFPWQHLTFYGLSIGAEGTIRYTGKGDAHDLAAIIAGTANWPSSPKQPPNLSGTAVNNAGQEAIDDLWHAGINSHGGYANAKDPQALARAIVGILNNVINQRGTGSGIATGGAQLALGCTDPSDATKPASCGYTTAFNDSDPKDWSGDVKKVLLDPATGSLRTDANGNPIVVWSAKAQLDAQVAVVGGVNGWDVNRKLVTMNDTGPTPFRFGNLTSSQQSSLTSGWIGVANAPAASDVLNFIRGDQSHEGLDPGNLRQRTHILGDFVYSAAVPVGAPSLPYEDATNPGYTSFKSSKASRAPMVYAAGNDGMLHAFIDNGTDGGKETWAYIPRAMFTAGDPNDTLHAASPDFQIGSRAYAVGGIPLFKHKFLVNATPRIWDVDFTNVNVSNVSGPPASGNSWHTILVGGLGAGGRAVYALDVTNPVALADSETTAAGKVLWEFTDTNLGYVYDPPTLVKTRALGWVALVASGYNNTGGKGFLYVLNPKTGAKLATISLPGDTGTDAAPTGLSTVRAFVSSRKDPYVSQAYSGDLKGNVWRFDLSSSNTANWKAELIATLKDANTKVQPITTGIRIEVDQNNNNRYIFVGTGKLLDQPDLSDTSMINSLYVIRDGDVNTPDPKPGTPYSRTSAAPNNLLSVNGTATGGFVGMLGRGWYLDATSFTAPDGTAVSAASQKMVTDIFADLQVVTFAFSWPATDPCAPPLSATLYARDFTTGASVLETLGGTAIIASAAIVQGIAGLQLVQGVDQGNGVMPVSALVTDMGGNVFSYGVLPPSGVNSRHRVSWRLLNN